MGVLVPPVESRALVYDVLPDLEEVVELPEDAVVVSAVFLRAFVEARTDSTSSPMQ